MARATCRICDGPLPPRKRSLCGAKACFDADRRDRVRRAMKKYEERTGESWHTRYAEKRRAHRRTYKWRERFPEEARRHDSLRRARKIGAAIGEPFTNSEIFERDGWVCGLCDEPIDRDLRHPEPGSASLDHVLPLSRGGAHSRENVQAAHLGCNLAKGARVA